MSRKNKNRQREGNHFTTFRRDVLLTNLRAPLVDTTLTQLVDHRTWHPDPLRGAILSSPNVNRSRPNRRFDPPSILDWKTTLRESHKAAVCVRRNTRREVLHALKRTGKGSGSRKRYNKTSEVKC